MKISHKLVLLVALPLIGLSFLGWRAFSQTTSVASEMGKLQSLTTIASQVSTLVHET